MIVGKGVSQLKLVIHIQLYIYIGILNLRFDTRNVSGYS